MHVMETTSRRVILITAILALGLSMSLSFYYSYKRKQVARGEYVTQPRAMPPHVKRPGVSEKQDPQKTKWGGWGSALLPIYTVGILLYVIYVIGKIMQKKFTNAKPEPHKLDRRKQSKAKRKNKTKLTMDEVRELERQLLETEAAIQQIFEQTNQAVAATSKVFDKRESTADEAQPSSRHRSISSSDTDGDMITRNKKTASDIIRPKIRKRKRIRRRHQNRKVNSASTSSDEEQLDTNSSETS